MIYYLLELLKGLDLPGGGILEYLSVRAMLASVTSMLFVLFAGKKFILMMQRKQIGETIRDLGLEGQLSKKGTPTMGGILVIAGILVGVLLFSDFLNIYVLLLLATLLWMGALGFLDDYIKVFRKDKNGLSEKKKLFGQMILALGIALMVWWSPDITVMEKLPEVMVENTVTTSDSPGVNEAVQTGGTTIAEGTASSRFSQKMAKSTKTTIPFLKDHEFDYKYLSPFTGVWNWYTRWGIYLLMIVFVIMACSNAVNLTDGLDGLAAGTTAIAGIVLGIFAWLGGNIIQSDYLYIMYLPGSGEVAVFMAAMAGSLLGFLWYNSYPAQIFMGDTGSLAIGGVIGVCAVLIRKELLLPLLCGIFFVEALSVIIQRFYFRRTKKKYGEGRRVFKMTPLHHHFQKEGIPALISKPLKADPEAKIVSRFWLVAIILAVSTIALLKIR